MAESEYSAMSQTDGRSVGRSPGGRSSPVDRPKTPLTWGKVYLIILAVVFAGEVLVMGIIVPGFWPEPASLWQEVALHAALLTILTALALLVVFSLLEKMIFWENRAPWKTNSPMRPCGRSMPTSSRSTDWRS